MILDMQSVFNVLIGIIIAGGAWWATQIWNAVSRLRDDIHELEVELPSSYLKKEDFNDAMKTLNDKLDRIWYKLEEKQDRP